MTTCRRCSVDAVGRINGEPLCQDHIREVSSAIRKRDEDNLDRRAAVYERQIPPTLLHDRDFGPAIWLLSAPVVADRAWKYVDIADRSVDWEGLLEESRPWSSAERLLVELALNLWSNRTSTSIKEASWSDSELERVMEMSEINPYGWGRQLDGWNFRRLLEALAISSGKRVVVFDPPELAESTADPS